MLVHHAVMVKGILNSDDHGPDRTYFGKFVECKEQGNIVSKIWLNSPKKTQELIQKSLSLHLSHFRRRKCQWGIQSVSKALSHNCFFTDQMARPAQF